MGWNKNVGYYIQESTNFTVLQLACAMSFTAQNLRCNPIPTHHICANGGRTTCSPFELQCCRGWLPPRAGLQ